MSVHINAICVWIILLVAARTNSQDCNTYETLPNIHDRNPSVVFSSSSPAICDDPLTTGWYRAGYYDMPTSLVPENRCGTAYGFYMDRAIPANNSEHDARACLGHAFDSCYHFISIKVKNCGQYRLYYLSSIGFCNSAYCFHLADNSSAPSYQVPKPEVYYDHLEWTDRGNDRVPQLVFRCDFQSSTTDPDLFYVVSWHANETQIGSDKVVNASSRSNGYLLEADIVNAGFRHGITLFCSVGAKFTETSASGVRTKSNGFFAGFKVLTPNLQIQEAHDTTLKVSPTVPFACENLNPNCKLLIHAEDPNMGDCEGNTFITESSRCQMDITGRTETDQGTFYTNGDYKEIYNMTLRHAQSEDSYDKGSHYTIALKTNIVKHSFWNNSLLASIPVNVYYTNSVWRGKSCRQNGDPYFTTFDGNWYPFQEEGSYLMYENSDSLQSVQLKTKPCVGTSWAKCGCGVAVRAGRDVFTIFTCNGSTIIDFPVCDDGLLDVRTDGDRKWKVTFPSGTTVNINMITWWLPDELNLDVYIYPSAADENSTRGLCGYLDGRTDYIHDYIMPDGTTTTSSSTFARSWELTEDYFIDPNDADKFDNLASWPKQFQLCVCPRATLNGTAVIPPLRLPVSELHCSYKEYIGKCQSDRTKPFECFLKTQGSKRRKRRDLHTHCYNVKEGNPNSSKRSLRSKRQVVYVVSETEARQQCENTFNTSVSFQGCSENIDGLSSTFMDSCISDYRITGEQFVVTASLDALKDTCATIIDKDVELQSSNPTLVEAVFNNTCLNDCSGQGQCLNGYCTCNSGFAGTDCSHNIENPPIISSLKVFCDTLDDFCDTISIYGRNFLDTNTFKCQVSRVQTFVDGTSVFEGPTTENGTQRSPFEAMCPLQKSVSLPSSNTFVYTYNISISNDGVSFSNISEVFVYNSLCQEMIDSNGVNTFNLRTGYCFINESCVPDGLRNPENTCQQCLVANDTFDWIEIKDCQSTTTVSSYETSQSTGDVATGTLSTNTVSIPMQSSNSDSPSSSSHNTYSTNHTSSNSALPTSTSQSTDSTNQSPQNSPITTDNVNKGSSTSSVATSRPTSPESDASSNEEGSTVIIPIVVGVVFGLITVVVGTVIVVKFVYKKQERPRNIFGSQISIQTPHGKAPTSTTFENPHDTNISRENSDLFSVGQQDKYINNSRPSSAASIRGTHLDFTSMMQPK